MTILYDVVNFNGDASCLDSDYWLSILDGGERSQLFRWLRLYVDLGKPMVLGFTGATLADIGTFNPESLALLRQFPDIFQIISRPFAHDLPFFRTDEGFRLNLTLGRRVAEHLIGRVSPFYLPPEFMQTNRQTAILVEFDIKATFIMATRFRERHSRQIPQRPFYLRGIPGGDVICMPASGILTQAYLASIQISDQSIWKSEVSPFDSVILWRDGESSFLLPDGLERERRWLANTSEIRKHLKLPLAASLIPHTKGYPIHPFSAWLHEMSMLWFIQRVRELENRVMESMSPLGIARWLHCINSDILSAVEKGVPVVQLRCLTSNTIQSYPIARSDRGLEGEALLEKAEKGGDMHSEHTWQKKALVREKLVCELL